MTKKRFMVDDAGTLIDMQTRNTYDYVSEVCPLLNDLNDENEQLKQQIDELINSIQESARMGADAICKPMMKKQWGNIE